MSVLNYSSPALILAEPDYEKALIISEFFKSRKIANVLEVLRDGIETLDFLKSLKVYSFRLKALLLNLNTPYSREVLTGISKDDDLKDLPVIIFSEKDKNIISKEFALNNRSYILKPMQLLSCGEIIKTISDTESKIKEPVLCTTGRTSYTL